MKRVYIAGCGGMLGEGFYEKFRHEYVLKCTDIDVNEEWLRYCDFRDYEQYLTDVRDFRADYLIHLGALTDLEYCELHPDETYTTNTLSVENAVNIANLLSIPIIYIGTAGIFDGKKEYYDDWDVPSPICHYARSKYYGEEYVRCTAKRYLILRAGWMMGGGPKKDKKFIQKLMRQIKRGKQEIFVVYDKLGTPTYTHDFAANAKMLLEREVWGLYNMVCVGMTSRYEVAQKLLELLGLSSKIKITKVPSEYFKHEYFAPRPSSERLLNKKLELRRLNGMRNWQDSLAEYLDMYYKDYLNAK